MVVVKRGAPTAIRVEAEKMSRAREIGRSCGLFLVPEVHEYDERGVLVMERIRGIKGIRRARLPRLRMLALFELAGRSLAQVHKHLVLPEELRSPLPPALDQSGSQAFLHGDFSAENVCVTPDGTLVLIDWQMSPRYGSIETWGTRYFDVCWFIGNLFRKPAYDYLLGVPTALAARTFLDGYQKEGCTIEPAPFGAYHRAFFESRIRTQESGLWFAKKALLRHGFKQWERFIDEF